ncbi:C-C motif chemokine 22 [Rousettus aegyptiacus]|uniref:C-C motif chemokine n=1 Tax=Rousettus aegyptiacus TaxID=9407 RepID=A0A7J8CEG0_ROUAE|nr:C-C motif chemokine 22 [Rousettus aegyptiacus]XP_016007112.1 C-C motif chemokine 22 [Rousettus aegyptiacus]XP_036087059.1 C-C motif chemokine 22 [Rousettus aegyptiacus]KAF6409273.1 C-C motif chemokine ligand 22 [Rousettus aegyptiacus]
MASLQVPLLAALLLLAVALQTTEAGPYGANVEDSICCRDYIRYPLPLRVVKDYYWTSESCRRPGIVLLTGRGREICADPKMPWVKKILQKLDK